MLVMNPKSIEVGVLLSDLVNTVEAVLTTKPACVWQTYGGFQRVYESVYKIFSHGCMHFDVQGNVDLWPFVVGLRVLRPELGPCVSMTLVPRPADGWIQTSLQKLQLADKIVALTSDREYVKKYYHPWALMCSLDHTSAVVTCLRALEGNSPTVLADVDPKLLLGSYQPPPGTVTVQPDHKNQMIRDSQIRALLWDTSSSDCTTEQSKYFMNLTASLPTSPVTDKECSLVWDKSVKENLKATREALLQSTYNFPKSKKPHNTITMSDKDQLKSTNVAELHDIQDASERSCNEIMKQTPSSLLSGDGKNVTLLPRESPDGSSDSCDWPTTSPLNHPSLFSEVKSPQLSYKPSSKSKVVHNEDSHTRTSSTGARPKEISLTCRSTQEDFSDLSDSASKPEDGIPPSLLQVNYGGESTNSNSSSVMSNHRTRGSQGSRTPHMRHRASSSRIVFVSADSDQDSEDTEEGTYSQSSRRRRRLPMSQQNPSFSVKSLVDCRGVLQSNSDCQTNSKHKHGKDFLKHCGFCDDIMTCVHQSVEKSDSLETTEDCSPIVPHTPLSMPTGGHPHLLSSTPLSADVPAEVVDGIACSAPERSAKQYSLPSQNLKKKTHGRSRSDGFQEIMSKLQLAHSSTSPDLESNMSSTKLDTQKGDSSIGIPVPERKRFMEDGGHSITPAADNGFFPRPQPGQSLIEFLSSKEFHKQHAALDKENAHFNISEAVIAALTQMQFNAWHQKFSSSPGAAEDSDEEIRSLQAQIREKRRQKLSSSALPGTSRTISWVNTSLPTVESTTDCSVYESPQSSAYNSESDLVSEIEEVEEKEEESVSYEDVSIVMSGKSTESEQLSFKSDLTSAENVAINLLKNFNEQRLPKASELEWLVSEQDVPQKLLPLPTSIAVGPDDGSTSKDMQPQPQLRGTSDWAPPRPQLILTLPTPTKRSPMMKTQGWRCAGCGMRVSEHLSRHFRFCNYLGRYFCTTCHSNENALIPARVLHKWDFKMYPVANFSLELIESMKSDPLFNVSALNPNLYKRCRHLHQTHIYRLQLYHTLPYINTCSRAHSEKKLMNNRPQHWATDPHAYSLEDLIAAKQGSLVGEVKKITKICINHIAKCQVCAGRGFICEVCGQGEAIFPFQLDSTALCDTCSACYHASCFCPLRCPRCIRRETRHLSEDDLG